MLTTEQLAKVEEALRIAASVFGDKGTTLRSPGNAARYLKLLCCDKSNEEFGAVWMDSRHNVLGVEILGLGSVSNVNVSVRRIIAAALAHNAANVILFHNHPSGDCEPSDEDIEATMAYRELLEPIDCRVLDHMVVGREVFSIASNHVIP